MYVYVCVCVCVCVSQGLRCHKTKSNQAKKIFSP